MLTRVDFHVASKSAHHLTDTVEKCLNVSRGLFTELEAVPNMPQKGRQRCVDYIYAVLNKANQVEGIQKPSTGYDLWALDEAWDTGTGRSNAEMHYELSKRSRLELPADPARQTKLEKAQAQTVQFSDLNGPRIWT